MRAPRWCRWLLTRVAPKDRRGDVVGDVEEAHRRRVRSRGPWAAWFLTGMETLDVAVALVRTREMPLGFSRLDLRLGLRMMAKHPGLTVLGSLSMAFAIFVGAGAFEFASQVVRPTLPLPGGDRLVAIELHDASTGRTEGRVLYDLAVWRTGMETVEEIGAYDTAERNLTGSDGVAEPLPVARMDAAGFRVAGVAPLLGRTLVEDDGRPGAPAVIVLGYDVWTRRFGADPDIVGTSIRIDGTSAIVVGVMPRGFGFPVSHEAWEPLDTHAGAYEPRTGPTVGVFGRLASGASLAEARTELTAIGNHMASTFPATHEHLRARVMPYALGMMGIPASVTSLVLVGIGLASNLPLVLFVVLVCGNVALLLFARAASREGELVVRSALGASRTRLVGQLFVEALVLAAVAAVLGLAVAQYGLGWALRITETIVLEGNSLPFWFHASLSPSTFVYTTLLTVVAAAVAGILPGLRITRDLRSSLQRAPAGGSGGFRFGGVWTVVIASQIAVTMMFPVLTWATRSQRDQELVEELDFPAHQYLSARIEMDEPPRPGALGGSTEGRPESVFASRLETLAERLDAERRVGGVTFAQRLPRQYHPWNQVEVDGPTAEPRDERGHRLASAAVALDYFEVMGVELVTGRTFRPSDLEEGPGVVVVNESFVNRILGGRNAVGQRVRYLAGESHRGPDQEPGPWHEIVGVVEDFGTRSGYGLQGMYHPAAPGTTSPVQVAVRVRGDPRSFAPVLRNVAAGVDPALRLHELITLDEVTRGQEGFFTFWTTLLLAGGGMALLLSLGSVFAVMAFTVARRTREIGVRVALGASRTTVVRTIFRRPLFQIALGVAGGGLLLAALFFGLGEGPPDLRALAMLAGYMVVVGAVCLLACIVPTARALSIEPSDALRVE